MTLIDPTEAAAITHDSLGLVERALDSVKSAKAETAQWKARAEQAEQANAKLASQEKVWLEKVASAEQQVKSASAAQATPIEFSEVDITETISALQENDLLSPEAGVKLASILRTNPAYALTLVQRTASLSAQTTKSGSALKRTPPPSGHRKSASTQNVEVEDWSLMVEHGA